jgi:hypothetical protein
MLLACRWLCTLVARMRPVGSCAARAAAAPGSRLTGTSPASRRAAGARGGYALTGFGIRENLRRQRQEGGVNA